jgi:hypothetical protein
MEPVEWHMLPPLEEPFVTATEDLGVVVVLTEALAGKRLVVLPSGDVAVMGITTTAIGVGLPTDAQVDRCMALGIDLLP